MPDNITGGLILSVLNMVIVFVVLGILAVVIELTHRIVSRTAETQAENSRSDQEMHVEAVLPEPVDAGEEIVEIGDGVPGITSAARAAIAAALSLYMEDASESCSVFTRDVAAMGAWTRSASEHSEKQGSGFYKVSVRWGKGS